MSMSNTNNPSAHMYDLILRYCNRVYQAGFCPEPAILPSKNQAYRIGLHPVRQDSGVITYQTLVDIGEHGVMIRQFKEEANKITDTVRLKLLPQKFALTDYNGIGTNLLGRFVDWYDSDRRMDINNGLLQPHDGVDISYAVHHARLAFVRNAQSKIKQSGRPTQSNKNRSLSQWQKVLARLQNTVDANSGYIWGGVGYSFAGSFILGISGGPVTLALLGLMGVVTIYSTVFAVKEKASIRAIQACAFAIPATIMPAFFYAAFPEVRVPFDQRPEYTAQISQKIAHGAFARTANRISSPSVQIHTQQSSHIALGIQKPR